MQVEVTDADREAAAQVNGFANWELWELCRPLDDDWRALYAKDFARHRIAERAAIVAWLRGPEPYPDGHDIADDIEAGEHLK